MPSSVTTDYLETHGCSQIHDRLSPTLLSLLLVIMSWLSVNGTNPHAPNASWPAIGNSGTGKGKDVQDVGEDDHGYEYRDAVLKAAGDLVIGRPKKRKGFKTSNTRPQKSAKANTGAPRQHSKSVLPTSDRLAKENIEPASDQHIHRNTNLSTARRKPLLDTTNYPHSRITQSQDFRDHVQYVQRGQFKTLPADLGATMDKLNDSAVRQLTPTGKPCPPRVQADTYPAIIEISSDDDTSYSSHTVCADSDYDHFDDSIFDEVLEAHLTSEIAEGPELSKSPTGGPLIATEAPFPPFLHPCLLDSLDGEAPVLNQKGTSTPSLKHTCFRTAEILRLCKYIKYQSGSSQSTVKIEMFTTVHEVKYADCLGRGQGIVFSDLFFPSRPPYITAISRTPYVAKDFTSSMQNEHVSKPIVKATLLFNTKETATPTQSKSPSNPNPQSPQAISPQTIPTSPSLEALDIQMTS